MTLTRKHKRVALQDLIDLVNTWVTNGVACYFVVLTDSRRHQQRFLGWDSSVLIDVGWQAELHQRVGLLVSRKTQKPMHFRNSVDFDARRIKPPPIPISGPQSTSGRPESTPDEMDAEADRTSDWDDSDSDSDPDWARWSESD
jgi:hypothetical protein